MSIDFPIERWKKIKETYVGWWEGTLERLVIPVIIKGREPGRKMPKAPLLSMENVHDLSIPAKDIIDRLDYELSTYYFLGDAFPFVNLREFGPGVVAAFLGAELNNATGKVWFHPKEVLPIQDLHFEYNPNNVWLNRILEICDEAMRFWQGQVIVSMPDLGGVLDILSTFRPDGLLLMDLYDYPEEVKRLTYEIHDLWLKYYHQFNRVLQPVNPGYTDWSRIYSDKPSYILQCDMSYMISNKMFEEFVKPELELMSKQLDRAMYHMDGVGELNHFDSLLSIDTITAIQWVPGEGKPKQDKWPDVMKKIIHSGKGTQVFGDLDIMDNIIATVGTSRGIEHAPIFASIDKMEKYKQRLLKYGIE